MTRIAIVAALPAELKPLVRKWHRHGPTFSGRLGCADVVATSAGMGAPAVTRACEQLLATGPLDALVSIGYAGSLSCGLQIATAYAVREVIDAATGEVFPTPDAAGQRLVTIDHVAGIGEKRELALQHQAVMVDMEAAAVARIARDHGLAFHCFKAITDGPNDKLPDFNRFTASDGHLRMPAFLAYAAVHPQYWGPLARLGKNSRLSGTELSHFVHRFFAGSQ
jgi:adenosylhomocysteine nucleosidase